MRTIGIVGSPRKGGNTEIVTAHALRAIEEDGIETELIGLAGLDIRPCNACMACQRQEICSINDDLFPIYALVGRAILMADREDAAGRELEQWRMKP